MHHKRWVKGVMGASIVLLVSFGSGSTVVTSTTMASETELAGMSFVLDKYCDKQSNAGVKNPEAVVAFAATASSGQGATQEEIDSIEDGVITKPTPAPTAVTGVKPAVQVKKPVVTPVKKPVVQPKSAYSSIGVSVAEEYVNIRRAPNTSSKILGKLYRGSAAKIQATVGDWVKISSGQVTGYIKKEFLAIGFSAEKLIDQFGTKWATVATQTLKVREAKNTNCTILTLIPEGETYQVIREDKEWVKIEVDGTTNGFVAKEFVKVHVRFKKAISIAEEKAEARRKARAAAAAARAEASARRASSSQSSSTKKSNSSSTTKHSSSTNHSNDSSNSGGSVVGSGNGAEIANYALKFVGNPYVYGGTSLTNGTDCSGFTQAIYHKFGISIPRTSGEQSSFGQRISVSNARAGDLIFYSSGGRVNHVAMCIGGGRVVSASTPTTGIRTCNMYYRTPYCARRIVN